MAIFSYDEWLLQGAQRYYADCTDTDENKEALGHCLYCDGVGYRSPLEENPLIRVKTKYCVDEVHQNCKDQFLKEFEE